MWHKARTQREIKIKHIRRLFCSDDKFNDALKYLHGIDLGIFENKSVNVNWSIQHGDLHGRNVLVSDDNQPVIIDYGGIDELPCSTDPITLELSPYFHPYFDNKYPIAEGLVKHWYDDGYYERVVSPNVMRILRDWSDENAYLDREKLAVIYSYCVRQLTYPDTNKDMACDLIKVTIDRFE